MNQHNLRFLRNEVIEEVTARRIREYESKTCTPVMLPVPVEEIIEQVLGLDFDWDEIEEMPGEQILAGLDAVTREILVNEKHVGLLEEKPGLYRSTIGHEAVHYDIDLTSWSVLYELANTAQVTISNLVVRLRRLDLIYMRDGDKTIYRSQDEFSGQGTHF